ncbi:uncharacterized protein VTP21DRAFT_7810 [Calcarisporiella thermophila]|uniref:uncharacterized protein n=1 Tax=Calcarisporiella thermophila TaxID=911321 RepID=UPI0037440B89
MSLNIIRRAYSTRSLIPPTISSTKSIGAPKDAARMERLVDFYKKLPKGSPEVSRPSGFWGRYKARYFEGGNASAMPILHAILLVGGVSYAIDYHFHLKHHKNVEHH